MKYSKKIVIGVLIIFVLIIAGLFTVNYLTQQKEPLSDVQEITEDEAIRLAKNCQIRDVLHTSPAIIFLKDGTERRYNYTKKFSDTIDDLEPKCGEVGDILF